MVGCRRSISPVNRMGIREVLIDSYRLVRPCRHHRELDRRFIEDGVDHVARHRQSAHAIADDTRSGGVAGEGEGSAGLSSRTVIEAVVVDFTSSRSRKGQRYCSAGYCGWYLSKGSDAEGTWGVKSVIVHEASIWLVIGEGRTVGVGMGGAVDDERGATV